MCVYRKVGQSGMATKFRYVSQFTLCRRLRSHLLIPAIGCLLCKRASLALEETLSATEELLKGTLSSVALREDKVDREKMLVLPYLLSISSLHNLITRKL